MIEVKEQCKGCYHFQVCANVLKQQLFIREKLGEENPSCEQFIPTADVVEVRQLHKFIQRLRDIPGAIYHSELRHVCNEFGFDNLYAKMDGERKKG